ncbi:hypothetical protein [Glycomyces albidus]|uniref:Uncharacterized protein n=1 Tax=Glycomyces albidus TaxID=2656774 RepID=A0A6L5G8V4_9ACTN|nr:hypothetical protein [Glycomyces albidus]MQM26094.1 hypothetical protein [Glycomyces albidus]
MSDPTPARPRLAPLPEPDPHPRLRRVVRIALGVAIPVVLLAAAVWVFAKPDDRRPPCCTERAVVSDPITGVGYPLPDDWYPLEPGGPGAFFSAGAAFGGAQGARVWVFYDGHRWDDLESAAEQTSGQVVGQIHAGASDDPEFLASEPTTVDGRDAHEIQWTVSDRFGDPIYGRMLIVPSEGGRGNVYIIGTVTPDDDELRDEVEWILQNVDFQ